MKKCWRRSDRKLVKGMFVAVCAVLLFMGQKNISHAQMTGKITAASARIRQQADMNSTAIGSVPEGTTVTIVNDVTDATGTRWYEVNANGTAGFIRADLLSASASADSQQTQAPAADGAQAQAETPMDAQYATVKVANAKVRSTPSTSSGVVEGLSNGTQVTVVGQSNGSDSKIWYYVNFTSSSGEGKNGFIRSDLLELGEMVPVEAPPEQPPQEEQPQEPQEEEQPQHTGYEVVYDDGAGVWYLYDYTGEGNGTYQNLEDVLAAAHAQGQIEEEAAKSITKQRIVIIVLIALVVVLAVVMTILIFKLRDAYDDDEDDEEEDEDDEDEEDDEEPRARRREETVRRREEPARRSKEPVRRREEREERDEPVRRKSTTRDGQAPARKKTTSSARPASSREDARERDAAPAKPAPKKKAKNFMADEDEFEFEFLNIKDKDRDV